MQELKDAFYAELGQNKPAPIDNPAGSSSADTKVTTALTQGKGKLKLKKVIDDPFASDNDDHEENEKDSKAEKEKPKQKATSKKPSARPKRSNDDEEEEERPKKKKIQ